MPRMLPPEIEAGLLKALNLNNLDGAIAIMRTIEPGWGQRKPGDRFALSLPPQLLEFTLHAEPPQIERFTEEQRKQLRITAVMQYFIGDQRGSEKWLPADIQWAYKGEALTTVRMCSFWAHSASDHLRAKSIDLTKKRIMGEGPKGEFPYARCPYCITISEAGPIPIDAEFEPGIKFPPLRGCTHPKYGCRCMVTYMR